MRHIQLVFGGKAWPAAYFVGAPHTVGTSGHGRDWETTTALGWWRSFAELDLSNDDNVIGFIRRRGDPDGFLALSASTNTLRWPLLQAMLLPLAGAWSTDPDGIDRVTKDGSGHSVALRHLDDLHQQGPVAVARVGSSGFELNFKTLGDFMIASAADMFARGALMRRCEVCGEWFELQRNTARICSAACKTRKAKGNM